MSCPDAPPALVMAGCESSTMMPVGLEGHVASRSVRGAIYGSDSAEAYRQTQDAGAVALVAHTEKWTPEQLVELPLDGFERFNLHASTFKNLAVVADLMLKADRGQLEGMPHPDAFLLLFNVEDPAYLGTWGSVLSRGARGVRLVVQRPGVRQLDPAAEPPILILRLLRARDKGWDVVAEAEEGGLEVDVAHVGAYRAEVRMVPSHLSPFAGRRVDLVKADRPWIYSNAIYAGP
ncbi:MAG: hypothetical protein HYZ28_04195 [Myxococcales bacterium]|nr:hypothetical protein [Myxococcales bacterium]